MARNTENEFSKLIQGSVVTGMHLIPIPDDIKRVLVLHPELGHLVQEKVYDMGILYKGKYCALELKNVDGALTFNKNRIEKHQIKNLKDSVSCGGYGYCLVRFKSGLTAQGQKRLQTCKHAIDICYAIDIKWLLKQKSSSIPIELLQKECIEVPFSVSLKRYDLRVLWTRRK